MALKFHERERLLNDDDDFSANRSITQNGSSTDSISTGFGSTGSSFSGFSSAFGSELSSTETESEEEDDDEFIAELTRKMADYMLDEDDEKTLDTPAEHHSTEKLQSTVINGIPASVSKLNFPAFSDDHSRAVHVYNLENQPSVKHGGSVSWARRVKGTDLTQKLEQKHKRPLNVQNRGKRAEAGGGGGGFASPAAAWPTLQQSLQLQKQQAVGSGPGSGMRAVFLGGSGSRSGSSGTGVFLPRGNGISNPPEVRKKSECSTVLIPARVIQALQLHFEDMNTRSQSKGRAAVTSHPPQHDVAKAQSTDPAVGPDHHEMDLPQEWTY